MLNVKSINLKYQKSWKNLQNFYPESVDYKINKYEPKFQEIFLHQKFNYFFNNIKKPFLIITILPNEKTTFLSFISNLPFKNSLLIFELTKAELLKISIGGEKLSTLLDIRNDNFFYLGINTEMEMVNLLKKVFEMETQFQKRFFFLKFLKFSDQYLILKTISDLMLLEDIIKNISVNSITIDLHETLTVNLTSFYTTYEYAIF